VKLPCPLEMGAWAAALRLSRVFFLQDAREKSGGDGGPHQCPSQPLKTSYTHPGGKFRTERWNVFPAPSSF
jgi:hypothetical protein